jgi:hypothetical protein
MQILKLSNTYNPIVIPKGAGASPTASIVGFLPLHEEDYFFSESHVTSLQNLTVTSSTASITNVVGVSTGSSSSYAYFANMLIKNYDFDDGKTLSSTTGFMGYLSNFRSTTASDINKDTLCNLGDVGIISIKKNRYGENILPLSFTATTSAGVTFIDSASANNEWGIITRSSDGASAGIIFYELGVALIHGPSLSALRTVSALTSVSFYSEYTIWQMNAFCTTMPNELNYTTNDSAFYTKAITSDPALYATSTLTASYYQWGSTSSTASKGSYYLQDIYQRNIYITSVGLYNKDNDLIAIAKIAQPIKKPLSIPITLRVAIDFD